MDSSADKEGLQSSGRKEQSSRHGVEPAPEANPVPGAFGRETLEGETAGEANDILDDDDVDLDDDDLDLDEDDDDDVVETVTEEEAERADGA
jgi:hypothetical protein